MTHEELTNAQKQLRVISAELVELSRRTVSDVHFTQQDMQENGRTANSSNDI